MTLRNYRIPEHHQEEVNNQIKNMKDGIIEQSQNPWNFPILAVPMKTDA
jgi:hypothetical protein